MRRLDDEFSPAAKGLKKGDTPCGRILDFSVVLNAIRYPSSLFSDKSKKVSFVNNHLLPGSTGFSYEPATGSAATHFLGRSPRFLDVAGGRLSVVSTELRDCGYCWCDFGALVEFFRRLLGGALRLSERILRGGQSEQRDSLGLFRQTAPRGPSINSDDLCRVCPPLVATHPNMAA